MSNFDQFIQKFPPVKLPVTLSEEHILEFSRENEPLTEKQIAEHILPYEENADELTEFIACLRIANLKDFHAIVYWRGGLMNYQYILVTFTKGGKLIDHRVLAGTFSDGHIITRSVARIDDDMSIYIMSGQTEGSDELYEGSKSTTIELELLPNGKMVEW